MDLRYIDSDGSSRRHPARIAKCFTADYSSIYTGVFAVRSTSNPNTQVLRNILLLKMHGITASLFVYGTRWLKYMYLGSSCQACRAEAE